MQYKQLRLVIKRTFKSSVYLHNGNSNYDDQVLAAYGDS